MSSEIKSTKRRNQVTRSPKANNYATKVIEGSHKQSHYKNKETNHKQSTEKKDNDGKTKEAKVKGCISCGVCSETTHSNILGCPEFQKYISGQPGGSMSTHKEVCFKCLETVFRHCMHNSLRY